MVVQWTRLVVMRREISVQSEGGNRCEWAEESRTGCGHGGHNPDYVGADENAASGPG